MSNKLSQYSIIFSLALAIFFAQAVVAQPNFNVLEDTIPVNLAPGKELTAPLTIKNIGTEQIALTFDASALDLTDKEGDKITLTFEPAAPELAPNESKVVTMRFKSDRTISFEKFGGVLTVKERTNPAVKDTVTLNMEVQPDVCDFGVVGADLDVDIKEPGSGDDFKPGEEIPIEVKVSNNGQNSIRVQTEAFLFSKSRNIRDTASETKTIDEDDDFTFTMSMVIPTDPDDIDEDEELRLVVKAFDDENEKRNCAIDMINVNVELEDEAVTFDRRESRMFPDVAACGDTVQGSVRIRNVGAEDNDKVFITLANRELGINLKSDTFTLEKFDDEARSTATRQFEIKIPTTAKEKSYPFTAKVNFQGGSEEMTLPFQVLSCQGPKRDEGVIATVFIRPLEEQLRLNQGAVTSIPIQITNVLNERTIYTIAVTNIGEIGQAGTKTITINPGQITTAFLDLSIKSDAEPGLYSGSIVVKQGGRTVGSQTLLIEVKEGEQVASAAAPTIQAIPLLVWVVLVILATGAVALAIMASFRYLKQRA